MSGSYVELAGELQRRCELRELALSAPVHPPTRRPRQAVLRAVRPLLDAPSGDLYADRGFVVDRSALVAATAAFWGLGGLL